MINFINFKINNSTFNNYYINNYKTNKSLNLIFYDHLLSGPLAR